MTSTIGLRARKKLDTWHAVRTAATELFLTHGYDAVSVDDIAAAAGISRAGFFNYFTAKDGVLFDPAPDEAERLEALLAARPDGEAPWATVRAVMPGYVRILEPRVADTRVLLDSSPALAGSGRVLGSRIGPALKQALVDRHPSADPTLLAVLAEVGVRSALVAFRCWSVEDGVERLHADVARVLDVVGGDLGRVGVDPGSSTRNGVPDGAR